MKNENFLLGSNPILLKMWLDSYIYLEFAFIQSGKKTCGNSKFKQEKQEVLVFYPKTPIGIQKKKTKKKDNINLDIFDSVINPVTLWFC